jgi:hypothetical protein
MKMALESLANADSMLAQLQTYMLRGSDGWQRLWQEW